MATDDLRMDEHEAAPPLPPQNGDNGGPMAKSVYAEHNVKKSASSKRARRDDDHNQYQVGPSVGEGLKKKSRSKSERKSKDMLKSDGKEDEKNDNADDEIVDSGNTAPPLPSNIGDEQLRFFAPPPPPPTLLSGMNSHVASVQNHNSNNNNTNAETLELHGDRQYPMTLERPADHEDHDNPEDIEEVDDVKDEDFKSGGDEDSDSEYTGKRRKSSKKRASKDSAKERAERKALRREAKRQKRLQLDAELGTLDVNHPGGDGDDVGNNNSSKKKHKNEEKKEEDSESVGGNKAERAPQPKSMNRRRGNRTEYDPKADPAKNPEIMSSYTAPAASGAILVGHMVTGGWNSNSQLSKLKAEGKIEFDEGYFTQTEDIMLTNAVEDWLQSKGLEPDYIQLILWRKPKELENDAEFQANKRSFWQRMNEALPRRQNRSMWHHLRTMYSPYRKDNLEQPWTREMEQRIIQLVSEHGPEWRNFTEEIGRTAQCIRDRYRLIKKRELRGGEPVTKTATKKEGKSWSNIDSFRLVSRLQKQMDEKDLTKETDIDWTALRDEHWGMDHEPQVLKLQFDALCKLHCRRRGDMSLEEKLETLERSVKQPKLSADIVEDNDEDEEEKTVEDNVDRSKNDEKKK